MASTRSTLESVAGNLTESMGMRPDIAAPRLSPTPSPKDVGRRPLQGFGRIDVAQVVPDPSQPRADFADERIERLSRSIKDRGQLSPIRVRWSDRHGKWMIIAGERRWRAARRAGLEAIECYFHESDLDASEILQQQLIENCLREDLRPTEEAHAFRKLMDLNGWNQKQLSRTLHLSETRVTRVLSLLKLSPEVRAQIDSGSLSVRAAYEISKLQDTNAQKKLADRSADENLTSQQTANAVRQRKGKANAKPRATRLTFPTEDGWKVVVSASRMGSYEEVEQALSNALDEVRHRIQNNVQLF